MIKVPLAQKKIRMQRSMISLFQGVYFYMHDSCESGVVTPLTEKIKLQKLFSEKRLTSEKLITRRILQYHVIYLRMSDALLCPLVFDFYEIWTDSGIRQRISFSKCQTCSAFGDLKAQFIMSNEREFKKWEIWETSIPEQKMNSKNIPICTVFLLVKFCF